MRDTELLDEMSAVEAKVRQERDMAYRILADICKIADIPPADDRFGSLPERMNKVWLLSRGFDTEKTPQKS